MLRPYRPASLEPVLRGRRPYAKLGDVQISGWHPAPAPMLGTRRLLLEPLAVGHADEMALALDDPELHVFTGGVPLTPERLRDRYRAPGARALREWLSAVAELDRSRAVGLAPTDQVVDGEIRWVG